MKSWRGLALALLLAVVFAPDAGAQSATARSVTGQGDRVADVRDLAPDPGVHLGTGGTQVTVDFEDLFPALVPANDTADTGDVTSNGFLFDVSNDEGNLGNGDIGDFFGDPLSYNGTTFFYFFATVFDNGWQYPVLTVSPVVPNDFTLQSLDISEACVCAQAESIRITGNYSAGGTVEYDFDLDLFLDGNSGSGEPDDDFETIVFPPTFTGLSSFTIQTLSGVAQGEMVIDNIVMTLAGDGNQNPIANAGMDQLVPDVDDSGDEDVTLDGSASFDPDGSITDYSWSEGPTFLSSGPSPMQTVNLAVGLHTITLTTTDDQGATDTDDVVINVDPPANDPPTADAGPNQTVSDADSSGSEPVTLDGSGSMDADGTIAAYDWFEVVAGPPILNTIDFESAVDTMGPVSIPTDGDVDITDFTSGGFDFDIDTDDAKLWNGDWSAGGQAGAYNGTTYFSSDSFFQSGVGQVFPVTTFSAASGSPFDLVSMEVSESWSGAPADTLTIIGTYAGGGTVQLIHTFDQFLDGNTPPGEPGDDWELLDFVADPGEWTNLASVSMQGGKASGQGIYAVDNIVVDTILVPLASGVSPVVDFPVGVHDVRLIVTDNEGGTGEDDTIITVTSPGGGNLDPVADAGMDQVVVDSDGGGDEQVSLDGSGSFDPDGTIASWVWSEGPTQIATGETATPTLPVGPHVITLTVTDNQGASDTDTVNVTVSPQGGGNVDPVADAGPDQVVTDEDGGGDEQVALDGTGSTDVDGTIVTYEWREGPTLLATGASPNVVLATGTHVLELTVIDDQGGSDTDIVSIKVNVPPVADAGPDQSVPDADLSGDEVVMLDGTASTDTDGSIVSYSWVEDAAEIATGATPAVLLTVGAHTITLTVTDDDGATSTDEVLVTVTAGSANDLPVADAGPDLLETDDDLDGLASVQLDGSASTDSDGTIVSYEWYGINDFTPTLTSINFDGQMVPLDTDIDVMDFFDSGFFIDLSNDDGKLTNGEQVFGGDPLAYNGGIFFWHPAFFDGGWQFPTATFTPALGTPFDLVQMSLSEAWIQAPAETVTITGEYFNGGTVSTTLTLDGILDGNDFDGVGGDIADFEIVDLGLDPGDWTDLARFTLQGDKASGQGIYAVDDIVVRDRMVPLASGVNPSVVLPLGNYTLRLIVTDDQGGKSFDDVNVEVNAAPVAAAGMDISVSDLDGNGSEVVDLDGSGSTDADGMIVAYEWAEGPTVLSTEATPSLILGVGTHVITLTVTDDDGGTDTDEVTVDVLPNPNTPPVADAGPDQAVLDADNDGAEDVLLDGSGSEDPDGTIASYVWTEGPTQIATGANPVVSLTVGPHTLTLTVTDDDGSMDSDDVLIDVQAPPIAVAGPDQVVTDADLDGTEDVVLDGSASGDADGAIVSYVWTEGPTQLAVGANPTVPLAVGTHVITLTVTDDDGNAAFDLVEVKVNEPPVADAGRDQVVNDTDGSGDELVQLDGTGSTDADGTIVLYEWREGPTLLAVGPTTNVLLGLGPHTLTLTVTDDDGAVSSNDLLVVVNVPPTADAGPDQVVSDQDLSGDQAVTFDGSGSTDTDGAIAAWSWSVGAMEIATGVNPTVDLPVGTYVVTLTVTDDDGATATDTLTVKVNEPPVADAGPDQVVNDIDGSGDELVSLDGSGTDDPDGQIASWVWSEGATQLATGEMADVLLTVGTHVITLTVTDGNGATATDTVTVKVNVPPTADAGPDQVVSDQDLSGDQAVTFDGSGSTDTDGAIAAWSWSVGAMEIATGVNPTVDLPVGTHVVTLTVTDDDGATATDMLTVKVNEPPVADAGPDQVVNDQDLSGDQAVTLDGTGSTDADGTIVSYIWREGGGLLATGSNPTVVLPVGTHVIELTVTDENGGTGTDTLSVKVNEPPVADAGPDQVVNDDDLDGVELVSLDGSGTDDPDGQIASWVWSEGATQLATGETADVLLALGTHVITLTVTDGNGATATDTVTVKVNDPPTADAGPDQVVSDQDLSGDESVALDGTGSTDAEGAIVSYVWTEGATEIATGASPSVDLTVGTHVLTLTVTDEDGATATDMLTVKVNGPPVAEAGPDQVVSDEDLSGDESVALDGSGSTDGDGAIVSYVWTEGPTQIATGVSPNVVLTLGTHVLTLTVTDDDGATATDTLTVKVNEPPTADAGPDQLVSDLDQTGSESVALDGTGSTDGDGAIVSYVWTEGPTQIATGPTPDVLLAVGLHTITLTVTDDDGGTDTDVVVIEVNDPPLADAGIDQVLDDLDKDGFEDATLDGSASTDSDGTIVSYTWSEGAVQIASGATPTVSLALGVHVLTLTVVDDDGASDTATVTVEVNDPPQADAGEDVVISDVDQNGSKAVVLDGSGSSDSDGTIVSWVWTEGGSEIGTGVMPEVVFGSGVHTVTLTVTDDDGATDTDVVVVQVNGPPDADAGPDQLVHDVDLDGEEDVTLNGAGSTDGDGLIVDYTWTEGGSIVATGVSPTITLPTGVHDLVLTVTDDDGASSTDGVQIVVNILPVADAGPDQIITDVGIDGSESVTLDGSASSDEDGTIVSYEWTDGAGGGPLATGPTPTVDLEVGSHVITLTVTDDRGISASDQVIVTVNSGAGLVTLMNGTATYSATAGTAYSPDQAHDGDFAPENGWSILAGGGAVAQTAVWETEQNVGPTTLAITMSFLEGGQQMLGRFRFSVTTAARSTFADGLDVGGDVSTSWSLLVDPIVSVPQGLSAVQLSDKSILVTGTAPETGTYTLQYEVPFGGVTGVRLEAKEHPFLPGLGPGLAPSGNFVLTELELRSDAGFWSDLGFGKPGTNGIPLLQGTGPLTAGSDMAITISNGLPNGLANVVLGFTPIFAPFQGGIMVPDADRIFFGVPLDGSGSATLHGTLDPGVPSGFTIYLQSWNNDPGALFGLSATNGVSAVFP